MKKVLYTRGSVDFFETYPGKYVPVPLRIRSESTEQTQRFLAREVLALKNELELTPSSTEPNQSRFEHRENAAASYGTAAKAGVDD